MITENVSTLKINKLTQAQYERELAAGNIKDNEIYLTPIVEVGVEDISDKFIKSVPEYVSSVLPTVRKHGDIITGTILATLESSGEIDDEFVFYIADEYCPWDTVIPSVYVTDGMTYFPNKVAAYMGLRVLNLQVLDYGKWVVAVSFTYSLLTNKLINGG